MFLTPKQSFLTTCIIATLIYAGLHYMMHTTLHRSPEREEHKVILLWNYFYQQKLWFWGKPGNQTFIDNKCPESRCVLTTNRTNIGISKLVLFHMRNMQHNGPLPSYRNPNQSWIFAVWESPRHTHYVNHPRFKNIFNRTFTYKSDSDIFSPIGYTTKLDEKEQTITKDNIQEIAKSKTKIILWYVSNCGPKERLKYGRELMRYVPVDMYGACGHKDPCKHNLTCSKKVVKKYKFYLAFENSKCREYITEKFWVNLQTGAVPVVRGASLVDYKKVAPPNSFLHVDNFTSPKELAEYIKYLDKNNEAYYKYHLWRLKYKVEAYKRGQYACVLCDLAHQHLGYKSYDIGKYWGKAQNCK